MREGRKQSQRNECERGRGKGETMKNKKKENENENEKKKEHGGVRAFSITTSSGMAPAGVKITFMKAHRVMKRRKLHSG